MCSKLTVYHGTNTRFDIIELGRSRNKRDFGMGFYTTTVEVQAKAWAKNMYLRYGSEGIFVMEYSLLLKDELNIRTFDSMNLEWLEMVKENRQKGGLQHNYDIVIGPVANDNTMRTIALYVSGIYTAEMALEQLKYFKVNDQVSLHTEKALNALQFIGRTSYGI